MLDNATALHLATRLGFGPAPGEVGRIRQLGLESYLEQQLNANVNQLPPALAGQLHSIPAFGKDTYALYHEYWFTAIADLRPGQRLPREEKGLLRKITNGVGAQARMARLARAIASPHRLQEALVDFWFNHFNVFEHKKFVRVWVGAYEDEAIRPHTLGRFSDLLLATARHPAMLVYLDNWQNVAPGVRAHGKNAGINENYAREVMELHTLGVDGGYTQADVTALAHILTGWSLGRGYGGGGRRQRDEDLAMRGGFGFHPALHDRAPQTLLGRKFENHGEEDGEAALLMLARHPSTARHISYKLAQYFVADEPPPKLTNHMADVFTRTGGDLREVTTAMLTSGEFRDPANYGRKLKTPLQYIVSVARISGLDPRRSAPLAEELKALGQPIYGCVTPDGYACTESAWLDPDAMMRRLSFAVKFGSGAYMRALPDQYGSMNKQIHLQPEAGGTPLDSDTLVAALGGELSIKTRQALAQVEKAERAGLVLGSPEFMRA
ncbi:MAG: DUF1800 domain-containing protein [Alphaproteobacteria bacterium]|nr:DUF1800 domain-containing protein [Alphaproteobacteria bacterium]